MKKSRQSHRAILVPVAAALLVFTIFLAITASMEPALRDKSEDTAVRPRSAPEPALTYFSQHGDETLRLVMDRFVARDDDGIDEVLILLPPATPSTLAKRLAEQKAHRGIFPVAIDENDPTGGYVIITSEIRAMIPRGQAGRFARENGLTIRAMPDYAPDWVVFSAASPLEAMAKIGPIREETDVREADILVGRRIVPMQMPNDPLIGNQWHLKAGGAAFEGSDMNVEGAWDYAGGPNAGSRGRGVLIGILDGGLQTSHPDFVGNINTAIDYDFVANDNDPSPVSDRDSHGTSVGGVAAARGNNGLGGSGVAPQATLVGHRLFGSFTTELMIADAFAHRTDVIQIKNNSWAQDAPFAKTRPLEENALKNSVLNGRGGKGTIFTFSAGNDAATGDSANYSEYTSSIYTIVVGATSSKGTHAFYSEPGANLLIAAPSGNFPGHPLDDGGLGITTTDLTGSLGSTPGDYTDRFNGTSSACPAVSGGIALMLEKNPELGWRDIQEILIRSAKKINLSDPGWHTNAAGLHFNNKYGAGLIDATAAVELAGAWTNLGPQTSVASTKTNLSLPIPDNTSVGRDVLFSLPGSNITTEHVTVRLSIDHTARGDLEITLFSPSGTASRLAEVRDDDSANYSDFTFSTVQNWGENSSGTWILKIADSRNSPNSSGGTIRAAEIVVYGALAPPDYSEWINSFGISNVSVDGDPDGDSVPNLVEYALGSLPGQFDNPSPIIPGSDDDSVWITYTKSNDTIDVTLIVEWSASLEEDSWQTDSITHQIMSDGLSGRTIRSSITIDPEHPAKFMRLRASLPPLE